MVNIVNINKDTIKKKWKKLINEKISFSKKGYINQNEFTIDKIMSK